MSDFVVLFQVLAKKKYKLHKYLFGGNRMSANEVVIVSAVRTPIGSFLGGLKVLPLFNLGQLLLKKLFKKLELNLIK